MAALIITALAAPVAHALEAAPAPTAAATAPPVVLWNTLTTATTKADMQAFKAQLPEDRAELLPGCKAQLLYRLAKGHLTSLIFIGLDKDKPCSDLLLSDLTTKYGRPEGQTVISGGLIGVPGGIIDTTNAQAGFRWHADGRKIELVKQPGRIPGYNLIYSVRPDSYLN